MSDYIKYQIKEINLQIEQLERKRYDLKRQLIRGRTHDLFPNKRELLHSYHEKLANRIDRRDYHEATCNNERVKARLIKRDQHECRVADLVWQRMAKESA